MRSHTLLMAETVEDLEGLPVGTGILTRQHKVLELDEMESGSRYWIEPGTLQPFSRPHAAWLPAFILPVEGEVHDTP